MKLFQIDLWKSDEEPDTDEDDDDGLIIEGSTNFAQLLNLDPATSYNAKVRVLNGDYEGPYSEVIHFTTDEGTPGEVENLEARQISSNDILVEWDEPEDPNGEIIQYKIAYEILGEETEETDDDDRDIYVDGDQRLAKISHVKEEVEYEINVFARTEAGFGNE